MTRALGTALLTVAILVCSILPASSPAHATTLSDCQAQIDALISQTQTLTISGQNGLKDREGLLGKLGDAKDKLAQGKPQDAIVKLQEYIQKVTQLRDLGRIELNTANSLIAGANNAITCIRAIGT